MRRLRSSAAVTSVAAAVLLAAGCSRTREPVRIGIVLPPDFAAAAGEWTLALAPNDSVEGRFIAGFVGDRR